MHKFSAYLLFTIVTRKKANFNWQRNHVDTQPFGVYHPITSTKTEPFVVSYTSAHPQSLQQRGITCWDDCLVELQEFWKRHGYEVTIFPLIELAQIAAKQPELLNSLLAKLDQ